MELNREVAQKVLTTVDAGLCSGMGIAVPGHMCVEAAVCYALGMEHSDDPQCVSPLLRTMKIMLNDSHWSSNAARARGLRRLAIAQLGTKDQLDERVFAERLMKFLVDTVLPRAFEKVGVELAPPKTRDEAEETRHQLYTQDAWGPYQYELIDLCRWTRNLFDYLQENPSFSHVVSEDFGSDVVRIARDLAFIATGTRETPRSDAELSWFGEEIVKILIELGARGTEWLDLTEEQVA